ncbi:hypothetical protein AC1031_001159 [Aphanomyces cochlioides]|nr:hypothetical protein AC1031_001159 [Aphanomyces cochlioides]
MYFQSYTRFIAWLVCNKPALLNPSFLSALGDVPNDANGLRDLVKSRLEDRVHHPIQFDQLEAPDFVSWLLSLRKNDGTSLSYSALNTHRASLFNLFREYGISMSTALEKELTNYFKGLKRTIAQNTSRGLDPIKVGKDPLSFEFYQFLSEQLLGGDKKEMSFERFWNQAWSY